MGRVQVVTDSACDLAPELAEQHHIQVVPLTIRFGDEEFVDRAELSSKEFWDRVVTGPDIPATAAPSPGTFKAVFEQAARDGADGVICVNLSSGVSATYQSACNAAGEVEGTIPIRIVDTQSMTCGEGLLALAAADLAEAGKDLETIAAEIEAMKPRTSVYGVVGTLDHLKKGGRIGGAAHLVGSLLSINPVIEVRDGIVEVESKQRTRSRALTYMAAKARSAGALDRIALVGGAAPDLDEVVAAISDLHPTHDLIVNDLGPVVGAHAGPQTIGLAFIAGPSAPVS